MTMNTESVGTITEEGEVLQEYGCFVHRPTEPATKYRAKATNLYYYEAFFGYHFIEIPWHSTLFHFGADQEWGEVMRADRNIRVESEVFAVLIGGYMLNGKTVQISRKFNLPYVNGCATKQVFQPERLGDPTVQLLRIPPHSAEQAHHIHSTVRVVHILDGGGRAVIGMDRKSVTVNLEPGMSLVLEPMCPHHFETDGHSLVCLPVHVFSSHGAAENNHPMFNGTFMMNHGMS